MLEPFFSLAIVEDLLASGYFAGAPRLHLAIARWLRGFLDSVVYLGQTLAAILASHPSFHKPFSPIIHTADSYCRPWRYIERKPYDDVPDADYYAWWGWAFYFRGLDTLKIKHFRNSEQAFRHAADMRAIQHESGDMPLKREQCASLDKLDRLLPLTELAIRTHLKEDVDEAHKEFDVIAQPLSERDPTNDYEIIACRYLGLIYHKCFASGVCFSPDCQGKEFWDELAYHKHVREQGMKFYEKAEKCGYEEVRARLFPDPRESSLPESKWALSQGQKLSTPGRVTYLLRWMAPWFTYLLLPIALVAYLLVALWVFWPQTLAASTLFPGTSRQAAFLLRYSPPVWLPIAEGLLYVYMIWRVRPRRRGRVTPPEPSRTLISRFYRLLRG